MDKNEYVCWYCEKCCRENEMGNACTCSTIRSKQDEWVDFKIQSEMVGLKTCPMVICKKCEEGIWDDDEQDMVSKTETPKTSQGGQR